MDLSRFTFYQSRQTPDAVEIPQDVVSQKLRGDDRLKIIGEMPRMLLIECEEEVANEWAQQLSDWVLQPERRASIPDPRPKLKRKTGS